MTRETFVSETKAMLDKSFAHARKIAVHDATASIDVTVDAVYQEELAPLMEWCANRPVKMHIHGWCDSAVISIIFDPRQV